MRRVTIIGALDIYARHELGLLAVLRYYGYNVSAFMLTPFINDVKVNKLRIEFDEGTTQVGIVEVPLSHGARLLIKELSSHVANNSEALKLYPEISNAIDLKSAFINNLNGYSSKVKTIFESDELRKEISNQIRKTYELLFSSRKNIKVLKSLIENILFKRR